MTVVYIVILKIDNVKYAIAISHSPPKIVCLRRDTVNIFSKKMREAKRVIVLTEKKYGVSTLLFLNKSAIKDNVKPHSSPTTVTIKIGTRTVRNPQQCKICDRALIKILFYCDIFRQQR